MSRIMNAGPAGARVVDRFHPPTTREPTLVLDVDLLDPLPTITGGAFGRAWLLLRVGDVRVGELRLAVPDRGLDSAAVGSAVAARYGQVRSRSRGRISPA
jgi:hypothetical protein